MNSVLLDLDRATSELDHCCERLGACNSVNMFLLEKYNELALHANNLSNKMGNLTSKMSHVQAVHEKTHAKLLKTKRLAKWKNKKLRAVNQSSNYMTDPFHTHLALVNLLLPGKGIINNVVKALVSRKKIHKHTKDCLNPNMVKGDLPALYQSFQKCIYSEVKEKFKLGFSFGS
jgi:hypothetical protein